MGEVAAWIPGPIGTAAGAISAVAYASQGNRRKAGEMALTSAANLVGAGAAVRVGMRIVSAGSRVVRRAVARVPRSFRALTRSCRTKKRNSFLPTTPVVLADGTTSPISEIQVGDLVVADDPTSGERSAQTVVAVIVGHGDRRIVEIDVDDFGLPLSATSEHPFWVIGKGWTPATDLRPGHRLIGPQGSSTLVRRVVDLGYVEDITVYNLTVDGPHTFMVATPTGAGALVHNCKDFIPGGNFSKKSKKVIRGNIKTRNSPVVRCKICNVRMVKPKKSKKGERPPDNEWASDHVRAKSKGGSNCPRCNGALLCRKCNRKKSDS